MGDFVDAYVTQVRGVFLQLGAPEGQAEVMARQLLKRAEQISEAQKISKVHAVESLLKKVVDARTEP